nr:putative feruloyl esterase c [Quercus suber]POE87644.1 putative feruloyl esterase c [Quercus suber]
MRFAKLSRLGANPQYPETRYPALLSVLVYGACGISQGRGFQQLYCRSSRHADTKQTRSVHQLWAPIKIFRQVVVLGRRERQFLYSTLFELGVVVGFFNKIRVGADLKLCLQYLLGSNATSESSAVPLRIHRWFQHHSHFRCQPAAMEASSKPARPWYKRPLPIASIAVGAVIVILIIVLPSTLLTRHDHNSDSSSGSSSATPTSSGGASSPTSTSTVDRTGCGNRQNTGFSNDFANQSLTSGDRTRNYSVNVPSNYNDDLEKRWPLILDFHGNSRNGTYQYNNSMYYASPLGGQYLAVYPEGVNMSWQGPSYAVEGVDDLQYTTDLLAHLNSTYCIDSSRIYASGKSNGGGFVDTLACSENGDPFAAFAMAAAALYTDNSRNSCNTTRAILEAHGLDDATIPYEGGTGLGGDLPDVRDWVIWWSERNGCSSSTHAHIDKISDANIDSYTCDGNANVTQHYPVDGMGHCWPSADGDNADSLANSFICPATFDYTTAHLLGQANKHDQEYFGENYQDGYPHVGDIILDRVTCICSCWSVLALFGGGSQVRIAPIQLYLESGRLSHVPTAKRLARGSICTNSRPDESFPCFQTKGTLQNSCRDFAAVPIAMHVANKKSWYGFMDTFRPNALMSSTLSWL